MTIAHDCVQSLGWMLDFIAEHPEWFGEGKPEDGAEYEWLATAKKRYADYQEALATPEELATFQGNEELEIDDHGVVASRADNGYWLSAWTWIDYPEEFED